MSRRGPLLGAWLAAAAAALAAPACAQNYSVVITPLPAMELGTVIAGSSGDTVFHIDPATGAATVTSGTGRRTGSGPAQAMVTIGCDLNGDDEEGFSGGNGSNRNACNRNDVPVLIGSIGITLGRAEPLSNFSVSMGTARLIGKALGSNPVVLSLSPPGDGRSVTFYVGADFPVAGDDSGRSTGDGYASFYVTAGSGSAADTTIGLAHVKVFRAVSLTKTSDLNFGRIIRPTAGGGTVSLSAASGLRTVTGGAGVTPPTPTVATFTAAGEGGQTLSIYVPATFTMTGPGTLTVTTNHTASGSPTLSGYQGQPGSYSFSVGGSFPISSSTPTGAYSGLLTVSVDYN